MRYLLHLCRIQDWSEPTNGPLSLHPHFCALTIRVLVGFLLQSFVIERGLVQPLIKRVASSIPGDAKQTAVMKEWTKDPAAATVEKCHEPLSKFWTTVMAHTRPLYLSKKLAVLLLAIELASTLFEAAAMKKFGWLGAAGAYLAGRVVTRVVQVIW